MVCSLYSASRWALQPIARDRVGPARAAPTGLAGCNAAPMGRIVDTFRVGGIAGLGNIAPPAHRGREGGAPCIPQALWRPVSSPVMMPATNDLGCRWAALPAAGEACRSPRASKFDALFAGPRASQEHGLSERGRERRYAALGPLSPGQPKGTRGWRWSYGGKRTRIETWAGACGPARAPLHEMLVIPRWVSRRSETDVFPLRPTEPCRGRRGSRQPPMRRQRLGRGRSQPP
jgi:hypothetical protein